jgi:hypothetical protein
VRARELDQRARGFGGVTAPAVGGLQRVQELRGRAHAIEPPEASKSDRDRRGGPFEQEPHPQLVVCELAPTRLDQLRAPALGHTLAVEKKAAHVFVERERVQQREVLRCEQAEEETRTGRPGLRHGSR